MNKEMETYNTSNNDADERIARMELTQKKEGGSSMWKTMDSAPKDESVIELIHYNAQMSCVYSAWWMKSETYEGHEGTEYHGHLWVLNDDAEEMIEEDTDLSNWFWRELKLPDVQGEKND